MYGFRARHTVLEHLSFDARREDASSPVSTFNLLWWNISFLWYSSKCIATDKHYLKALLLRSSQYVKVWCPPAPTLSVGFLECSFPGTRVGRWFPYRALAVVSGSIYACNERQNQLGGILMARCGSSSEHSLWPPTTCVDARESMSNRLSRASTAWSFSER